LSLKKSVTFDIIGFIEKIGDKNLPKNLKMGLKIGSYLFGGILKINVKKQSTR
jgi:hypothetical protein